ncbi:MAG TPA: DUF3662 and FHA domain-containing protein [Desulfobacteria bacterium]|nr:DUF3662 and FHA domain-containing protein [Desulfobacteria bacterium]
MGFFTKLEKISEKYIEGFFKSRFADHIQPAEIAKILWREMRDSKNVSVSKVYVPNHYVVLLGAEDWKTVDSVRSSLSRELNVYLKKKAREKAFEMVGDVAVSFALDEDLTLGSITVESSFVESPKADEAGQNEKNNTIVADKKSFYNPGHGNVTENTVTNLTAPAFTAELLLKTGTKGGEKFALGKQGVIIGRRKTNEIYIEDANVSRSHASIDYSEGSHFITDLGSTNGTFVNGSRVSRVKLETGNVIKVGTTLLEYKVV